MTTSPTASAVSARPPEDSAGSGGSLLRAELHRIVARRFVRVLALLGILGFAAGCVVTATQHASPTPEALAEARAELTRQTRESQRFYEECREQPLPTDAPEGLTIEEFCGPPPGEQEIELAWFLDRPPFVLADDLPAGAVGVGGASAALGFLLGATYVGAEWSTRSLVALLLWEPRRLRVVTTKVAVATLGAAVLGLVGQLAWLGAARLLAATRGVEEVLPDGFWADVAGQQARTVLLVVLVALLGFGIANLTRNTGAALGVGFVYVVVIESAVRVFRPGWQEWLLTENAAALVLTGGRRIFLFEETFDPAEGSVVGTSRELLMSNLHGGVVLASVTAVVLLAGALAFRRTDLT